ncbi:hypothetical protein HJFPF1_06468 [Paramyrothecium foliicola]|nr:hypothetical protein HJFPF1_06468 [Paramyrothecium foliicola]
MGSSQPPSDSFLPFGYAVDTDQEPLFDVPEPAPGAPLLSETDSKLLTSFFENFNQYDTPSFGEGISFSDAWMNLPPQFMGSTTSFGQQPAPLPMTPAHAQGLPHDQFDYSRMISGSHAMPPPPPPPHQQVPMPASHQQTHHPHPTEDVLTAAATLIQNGAAARVNAPSTNGYGIPRRPIGPPVGHLRHQPLEEFKEENRRSMMSQENDDAYSNWMWGAQAQAQAEAQDRRPSRPLAPTSLQWGSDSNFSPAQGYISDQSRERAESLQQERLKVLECFEVSQSASTTRPSSPVNNQPIPSGKEINQAPSNTDQKRNDADAPPRKRRKSKNVKDEPIDDDADISNTNLPKASRRRKSKVEPGTSPTPPQAEVGSANKRRKSAVNGAKPSRENLSEEQKRENHIRSEQKRRTLIKEGFDDLCELVPGLKAGGFSKSTMLTMAADWLEEILKGNKELAAQLSAMEG